jgi:hypothetical protein
VVVEVEQLVQVLLATLFPLLRGAQAALELLLLFLEPAQLMLEVEVAGNTPLVVLVVLAAVVLAATEPQELLELQILAAVVEAVVRTETAALAVQAS